MTVLRSIYDHVHQVLTTSFKTQGKGPGNEVANLGISLKVNLWSRMYNFRKVSELLFRVHRSMACAKTIMLVFLWDGLHQRSKITRNVAHQRGSIGVWDNKINQFETVLFTDSSPPLMHYDVSYIGSLILIQITPKEPTLRLTPLVVIESDKESIFLGLRRNAWIYACPTSVVPRQEINCLDQGYCFNSVRIAGQYGNKYRSFPVVELNKLHICFLSTRMTQIKLFF